MGAPTKLTPELTQEICDALERGNYLETAAEAAGITVRTVYNWMDRGSKGDEPYAAFFHAVKRARAAAEIDLVATVLKGDEQGTGFGEARAAAYMLERTRPDRFAQRVNLKVRDAVDEVLECVRRVCSPEDFARVLEELSRRDSGEEAPTAEGDEPAELH